MFRSIQKHFHHPILLIKRLGILLLLFTLCRGLFLLFNTTFFHGVSLADFIMIFLHGIRFDISAIIYFNILFIILHLIPLPQRGLPLYQKILKILFYLTNTIALFANCADMEYFRYNFKRSTADVFTLMGLGDDLFNVLPQYIKDFWHVGLILLLLILIAEILYRKVKVRDEGRGARKDEWRKVIVGSVLFIVLLGLFIIGARGGLQLKPIGIITAGQYTAARNIPLVLNTPFAVINTLGKHELIEVEYFTDQELNGIYSPYHTQFTAQQSRGSNINIVIIILESFSNEYIGRLNGGRISYTPFLDSLIGNSLVFNNCFANGKTSIEAIPAVVAGLPTLMNNPYITSFYAGNDINSLASILKQRGYQTSFFHGGNNGTMGFDAFAKTAGFEHYYGRNEYNNDKDYDEEWGIFDEEFFQFFAGNLNNTQQPFFSCLFSLTSHHPYFIPKRYEGKFKEGELKIHKCISYTDYALRQFFKTASGMPWFGNTLFVITADHTAGACLPFYKNRAGIYAIPLIFYKPKLSQGMYYSNMKGVNKKTVQQADIMPSVLDYLNYKIPFLAFGESVFDSTAQGSAVNFLNGVYQIIEGYHILLFDGEECTGLYNFKNDVFLQNNLLLSKQMTSTGNETTDGLKKRLERKIKAVIQSYNHRLINNKLTVK
ncbi:MAG: sulfatase-like hydrolase/transferase [Bacteroidota bacterium]